MKKERKRKVLEKWTKWLELKTPLGKLLNGGIVQRFHGSGEQSIRSTDTGVHVRCSLCSTTNDNNSRWFFFSLHPPRGRSRMLGDLHFAPKLQISRAQVEWEKVGCLSKEMRVPRWHFNYYCVQQKQAKGPRITKVM